MTHVVIDADQLVYAAGFATEGDPLSHTLQLVKKKIEHILSQCKADTYQIYIAGKGNYREDIAITKTYKGTRPDRKPSTYKDIRKYLHEKWNAILCDGIEADDVVSMALWEDYQANGGVPEECEVVCCSPDKDLKNTPGWHYNPRTEHLFWVSEKQAERHFAYQMLCGDKVDNIPGLPYCTPSIVEEFGLTKAALRGCGEGSAKKIMEAIPKDEDPLPYVYRCYASWAFAEGMETYCAEYIHEQGQLLWMLREKDDFDEYVMWHPHMGDIADAIISQRKEIKDGPTDDCASTEPVSKLAVGVDDVC